MAPKNKQRNAPMQKQTQTNAGTNPVAPVTTPVTPPRPANVPVSSVDPGSGKSYNYRFIPNTGRDGMGVWAAGPRSDEEIRALYPQVSATQASPSNTTESTTKPTSLGQVLRIAGGGGGIGLRELKSILDTGNKNVSGGQVVKRLDKINERLADNGMTGITLKSGSANFLTRQAAKQVPWMNNFLGLGKSTFGPGKIGQALQGMVGTRETGGYQGKDGYIGGASPAVARTILPRGMDLMPSGRQTVSGIGKQYEVPSRLMQPSTTTPTTAPTNDTPEGGAAAGTTAAAVPTVPTTMTPETMDPFQTALANWATGFKTARSSRKRSDPRAQGLASQRVIPTGGFRGGM